MNILLIDADSTIPNLALMKLSQYHKQNGDEVDFIKLQIQYYPRKKNRIHFVDTSNYDLSYCSVIFENSKKFISGNNIVYGGTGYDLKTNLPDHIENLHPDYLIYPDNNISYGFISRGCIRNCWFCKVPEKEGLIKQVSTIDKIVQHKKVYFLDNNFLALKNHETLLNELIYKNIRCQFNQGLDIRLVNKQNSTLLSKLNYIPEYVFALDDVNSINLVKQKLLLLNWRKDYQFKFFVYVHPNMSLIETLRRIDFLKNEKCLPYIMRDISCFDSEFKDFYTDLASWCNQPGLFKHMSFEEFMTKRYTNQKRIDYSLNLYRKESDY